MMISWGRIVYGAGLSAVLEVLVMVLVPKWRKLWLVATTAAIGFLAPFGWQAVLKITHSREFFTDLPIQVIPISWQDTGSGVITFGIRAFVLSYGPMRNDKAREVANLALATGLVAFLVDVYLY